MRDVTQDGTPVPVKIDAYYGPQPARVRKTQPLGALQQQRPNESEVGGQVGPNDACHWSGDLNASTRHVCQMVEPTTQDNLPLPIFANENGISDAGMQNWASRGDRCLGTFLGCLTMFDIDDQSEWRCNSMI